MNTYFINEENENLLMSQTGVKQHFFPNGTHNAIWDSKAGPDGKFYIALASEISASEYARFYSYDYHTDSLEELFRSEDITMPQDRAIRGSKFHSSISFMGDGRVCMTTHTTDKSPRHPTWMPFAYYHHLWEGFAGSHVLIYDTNTKKAESLGIPVPHESIYGAVYEPAHDAIWFLGMFHGHLHRLSLKDRKVKDLGKVSENYSFRLALADDGNIYGASRSGWLYMVDVDKIEIVDMGFQFPHRIFPEYPSRINNLSIAHTGPDKRLYMAGMYSDDFFALDTRTRIIENMGPYMPAKYYSRHENRNVVWGMDFDNTGVLWYGVSALNDNAKILGYGIANSLFRWDIARGGKPEWVGVIGTPERGGSTISEISITKDNILYAANSNHALDGPSVIGVDLNLLLPDMENRTEKVQDEYNDPDSARYKVMAEELYSHGAIISENPCRVPFSNAFYPVRLWRELAPDRIPQSAVKGLYFEDEHTLHGVCGQEEQFFFTICDGKLISLVPSSEAPEEKLSRALLCETPDLMLEEALPCYPGRQYKAKVVAAVEMADGKTLAGTLDGMLALVVQGEVYGLGPAAVNGPIHCMAPTPDRRTVYGLCGDEQDLTSLFSYNESKGLRWLGFMIFDGADSIDQVYSLSYATACAVSPDGRILAVGSNERMGTVVFYNIQ